MPQILAPFGNNSWWFWGVKNIVEKSTDFSHVYLELRSPWRSKVILNVIIRMHGGDMDSHLLSRVGGLVLWRCKGKLLLGTSRSPHSISSLASGPSSIKQPSLCWAINEEVCQGHTKAQRVWDWDGRRQDGEMKGTNFIPLRVDLLIRVMAVY